MNRMQKISQYIFLITVFLAPIVFIPSVYFPTDVIKVAVLSIGILLSSIFCIISSIRSGNFKFHKNPIVYSVILLAISVLFSALGSTSVMKSFIGQGFEIGTASFLFLMFATFFLVTQLTKVNKDFIFSIYITITASAILLVLFHLVRLIGGADVMSFGILSYSTSTFIGKWYDFAIFTGLLGLISFFGIKFLSLTRLSKITLYIALLLSGFFLLAINFKLIWTIIALVILGVIIYEFYTRTPKVSLFSILILIISVFGAWTNNSITANISKSLSIEQIEVVLPWQLTMDVASETVKESPFFGAGPNRFGYQYLKFKPFQDINPTQFWNTEFTTSFGTLPTFIVNQGLVGSILWILFLIFFIREGIKSLKRPNQDISKKFFIVSSFFSALFLWIVNIVYIPSHTMLFLTFVFTGLFISTLFTEEDTTASQSIPTEPGISKWLSPLLYTIIAIVLIFWLGLYVKKVMAISYFQGGIKELSATSSPERAEAKFKKALSYDMSDVYYQALSEVDIMKLNLIVKNLQDSGKISSPDKESLEKIAAYIKEAVEYSRKAQAIDPTNYYNYLEEARVSEIASSLKIENSYEGAKNAYAKAIQVNQFNPSLYLSLARLLTTNNDLKGAQEYIGKALQLKQNYTEAIFLLSQIQVTNGQIKEAITSVKVATQINPNDQTLFLQLGLLQYNDKNYSEAITALEKALSLDKQYANARYFLGLSYIKVGRNADAIAQFDELVKTNPDNKEITLILSNLRAGKDPFANAQPPIDSKPEKRKTPPVTDKVK